MTTSDLVGHLDPEDRADALAAILGEIRRRTRAARARETHTKRCPRCQEVKPYSEFGRNAARGDGLQSVCRACR